MHGSFQTSFRNSHVNAKLSDSKKSVGEESIVPLGTTLGVRMTKKTLKTYGNNNGVWRFTWVKYPVQILTYDGFVAHH